MRNSRSRSVRSGFGTSRISSNDAAPRAIQPHTCLRRYAGAPCSASHSSSAWADNDRTAGRSITGLRYRPLVDLFALGRTHFHFAVVDELLEMSAQRHLGRTEQFASQLGAVDAARQVGGGSSAAFLQLRQHLRLAGEPMCPVLLELRHRISDRVPVARKQHPRLERLEPLQGAQVGGDVAFGKSDHRAAPPEDEVTGEKYSVLVEPEAQVIRAVAGRMESSHVEVSHPDDVAIRQLRVTLDRGTVTRRQALCQRQMVAMGVRHQHDAYRSRPQSFLDRIEMRIVIRTWVDDDRHRTGVNDPSVRARPRVWTRIWRDNSAYGRHRDGWAGR